MSEATVEARKLELIEWLVTIDDVTLLNEISAIKEQSTSDWWNVITEPEKASIALGIEQANLGQLHPHSKAQAIFIESA